jgi:tetratricopeptide (TPR) repeat protein
MQRGDYDTALAANNRSIELHTQLLGADSVTVLGLRQDHGLFLGMVGRYQEAASGQKSACDEMERLYGDDSDDLATGLDNYATTLVWLGRYGEARDVLQHLLTMSRLSPYTRGAVRCDLARVLAAERKLDDAIKSCELGLAEIRSSATEGVNLAINEDPLAAAYLATGRFRDALAQSRQCLDDYRKGREGDSVDMVPCYVLEGTALFELGQAHEARTELEKALALQADKPAGPGVVANLDYQLARALVAMKADRGRARDLVTKAHDELAKLSFKKPLLDEVDAWRAQHSAELR